MSVVGFAQERPDSPRGEFALGKYTTTRKFLVVTNSVADGPGTVALAIGLPRLFQPYTFGVEFLPNCRCRSVTPERIKPGSLQWEVTCVYETPDRKSAAGGEGGSDRPDSGTGEENDNQWDNPLLAIPEVETRFETYRQPIYGILGAGVPASPTNGSNTVEVGGLTKFAKIFQVGDDVILTNINAKYFVATGLTQPNPLIKPVSLKTKITAIGGLSVDLADPWSGPSGDLNSATLIDLAFRPLQASNGQIFDPPPEMDQSRLILTITRNEDISTPHLALSMIYLDKLNADVFWGATSGQVKCKNITTQRQVQQLPDGSQFTYLRSTYTFEFRQSWDIQLLDKGSFYMHQVTMADPTPQPVHFHSIEGQPIDGLLDGNGGKLADGGNPIWLTVRPYDSLPFTYLNLPQSFLQVQ
jgi:hypothetical protein